VEVYLGTTIKQITETHVVDNVVTKGINNENNHCTWKALSAYK